MTKSKKGKSLDKELNFHVRHINVTAKDICQGHQFRQYSLPLALANGVDIKKYRASVRMNLT
jgi:hypothetical protein